MNNKLINLAYFFILLIILCYSFFSNHQNFLVLFILSFFTILRDQKISDFHKRLFAISSFYSSFVLSNFITNNPLFYFINYSLFIKIVIVILHLIIISHFFYVFLFCFIKAVSNKFIKKMIYAFSFIFLSIGMFAQIAILKNNNFFDSINLDNSEVKKNFGGLKIP